MARESVRVKMSGKKVATKVVKVRQPSVSDYTIPFLYRDLNKPPKSLFVFKSRAVLTISVVNSYYMAQRGYTPGGCRTFKLKLS